MKRIMFLDIDGVFIPTRADFMATQTKPITKTFDPCAVGMVNRLCHNYRIKLVIHSSWLRTAFSEIPGTVQDHMIEQGLKKGHFHADHSCKYSLSKNRWGVIHDWLDSHQGVKQWWVIDDEIPTKEELEMLSKFPGGRIITTDFDEGIRFSDFRKISKDCGAR